MMKKSKKLAKSLLTEEEAFQKALSKCRNCGHMRMAHSFLQFKKGRCLDATLSSNNKYSSCTCREWASSDNLVYLEEIYRKKNNA